LGNGIAAAAHTMWMPRAVSSSSYSTFAVVVIAVAVVVVVVLLVICIIKTCQIDA